MKYFILCKDPNPKKAGLGPSIFYDAAVGLKITTNDPKSPVEYDGKITKKMMVALKNGHIQEVQKGEAAMAESSEEVKSIEDMNGKELLKHYKENYDVSEDDVANFKSMSVEDRKSFLLESE